MNALMRIEIRVVNQTARELAQIQRQLGGLGRSAQGAGSQLGRMGGFLNRNDLERYGKNLQWTGRQIEYNFTLPIMAAGIAATKFAMDNERAFTRLEKVYGNLDTSAEVIANDLELLRRGFRALSDIFGVHQKDVIEIGAAWAAAGAQGYGLAQATKATLQTMILGDMEAAQATEALIAIQAQFGVNSTELIGILAQLNAVENQTAVSFSGLVQAFQRAAGTARTAGVSARELAALIAAITPAAGSAAQAGNSLRTMLSRVIAPTGDASRLMRLMGLEIDSVRWNSMNGTQRLIEMAKAMEGLTDGQKGVVAAFVASRYQITRFDVLMRELISQEGYFAQAMRATEGGIGANSRVMQQFNREIGIFLRSSPQAFKIMTVRLQNLMAQIIMPLIPAIIGLMTRVVALVDKFTQLSPAVQQLVLGGLLLLAVFGTLQRYLGAAILLWVRLSHTIGWFGTALGVALSAFGTLLHLPFAAVAAAFGMVGRAAVLSSGVVGAAWTFANKSTFVALKGILLGASLMVSGLGRLPALMGAVATASSIAFTRGLMLTGVAFRTLPILAMTSMRGMVGVMSRGFSLLLLLTRANMLKIIASIRGLLMFIAVGVPRAAAMMVPRVAAVLLGPWGLLFAALAGVVYAFRDQIARAVRGVVEAFNRMPGGIVGAMRAVIQVIARTVKAAFEWLSYLNPFARHSPSLVEQVQAGVALISRAYGSLANIGQNFRRAVSDLEFFKKATAGAYAALRGKEIGEMRSEAVAVDPRVGPAFDLIANSINNLNDDLELVGREFARQEPVVQRWKDALDAANVTLDTAQSRLDALESTARQAKDALDAARETLDTLSNTPIAGMRAMSDAIFANDMAAKQLQLDMMRWEEINGPIDKIEDKLAGLAGQMEMVRAERSSLREAGAGSDILGVYDAEIAGLEAQRDATTASLGPIQQMQTELEKLRRQGEMLDLENSLTFDPLLRQVDQLVNGLPEIPFDQLMQRISASKDEVTRLTAAWDQADAAVRGQQAVVDSLTQARDELQRTYDAEKARLDSLGESYDAIEAQIRAMESAMTDFAQAANKAKEASDSLTPAEEAFLRAGAGDIPDVQMDLPAEAGDLEALVKSWEEESRRLFAGIDMFKPIKDMFRGAWQWIKNNLGPIIGPVWEAMKPYVQPGVDWIRRQFEDGIGGAAERAKNGAMTALTALGEWLNTGPLAPAFESFLSAMQGIADSLKAIWDFIGDEVMQLVKLVIDFIVDLTKAVFEELQNWLPLFKDLVEAIGVIWDVLITIFKVSIGIILAVWKTVWPLLIHVLKPIFDMIVGVVRAALEILRGIITVVLNLITGDWDQVWSGILTIVDGVWDLIYAVIKGALGLVLGLIRGFVQVGMNIVVGIANGIAEGAKWIWGHITSIVKGIFSHFDFVPGMLQAGKNLIIGFWNGLVGMADWLFDKCWGLARDYIYNPIKRALGWLWPGSPSRAGIEIGKGLGTGFVVGTKATSSLVANAAGGMADMVMSSLPLAQYAQTAGEMMGQGLTAGLMSQADQVAAAANVLATAAVPDVDPFYMPGVTASTMNARIRGAEDRESDTLSSTSMTNNKRELHFHGNLEFPNIQNGDDAEAFIRNLESLAD